MPVSPDLAADLAKRIVELYTRAEHLLLEQIARLFLAGEPTGQPERKLLQVQTLRRRAQRIVDTLIGGIVAEVADIIGIAYNRGVALAGADLAQQGPASAAAGFAPVASHAVQALVDAAVRRARGLAVPILRGTEDTFRRLVYDEAAQVVVGVQTRRQGSAALVSKMAAAGIVFTDASGRRWEAGAYAEMAVRTAAGQALVQGHLDRFQEAGHDLVVVSDAPEECALCRPWEGRILSISGRNVGTVTGVNPLTGGPVSVSVRGSVAQARAAGLWHPNCRHSVTLFIPGITKRPLVQRTPDPAGDKLRQEQRRLERGVRSRRRQLATLAAARKAEAARRGRKTLPAADPVEAEYRRVRGLERAATARHDAFVTAHNRKPLPYRLSPTAR